MRSEELQVLANMTALVSQYRTAKNAGNSRVNPLDEKTCSLSVQVYDERTGTPSWRHLGNLTREGLAQVIKAREDEIAEIRAIDADLENEIARVFPGEQ